MESFKKGGWVRLTGFEWEGDGIPNRGETRQIVEVQGESAWILGDDGYSWQVYHQGADLGWGVEIVDRPEETDDPFEANVRSVLNYIRDTLVSKNKSYGNSALDPVRIFSKASTTEQLRVRIDDKISRLQRGTDFEDEDTVTDLIGYLVLLKIAEGK